MDNREVDLKQVIVGDKPGVIAEENQDKIELLFILNDKQNC